GVEVLSIPYMHAHLRAGHDGLGRKGRPGGWPRRRNRAGRPHPLPPDQELCRARRRRRGRQDGHRRGSRTAHRSWEGPYRARRRTRRGSRPRGLGGRTKWRGMFEERMKSVIKHAESADGKIILFIDEMHMLIGAGDWMCRSDAANILKPALARGRIRCLGATTYDEYRKNIETDAALERRFQKVDIQEPSTQATIAILKRLRQRYQDHYGLKIPDAAIDAAVHLADRYITGE
uniref:ClpA/ClpB AAA lid domain-containing protein n=1 Tax=Aegilops tauschii subsp. strangulata TaxID=200361 RepID=A0A453H8X4_AEGTS